MGLPVTDWDREHLSPKEIERLEMLGEKWVTASTADKAALHKDAEAIRNQYRTGRGLLGHPSYGGINAVLRAATNMTQVQLAEKVGISRQTIVVIETRKRPLSWSLYLAVVFVFEQYEESSDLLGKLDLYSSKFIKDI